MEKEDYCADSNTSFISGEVLEFVDILSRPHLLRRLSEGPPGVPRSAVHIGRFRSSRFMSDPSAQCQSRTWAERKSEEDGVVEFTSCPAISVRLFKHNLNRRCENLENIGCEIKHH